jgi:hypothetical protein
MKAHTIWFALLGTITLLAMAGCGGAPAATQAPAAGVPDVEMEMAATEPPIMEAANAGQPPVADAPAPAATAAAFEIKGETGENVVVQTSNRKIIKNGEMRLLVKDTDVAIDRATQVITDLGGYIVSSRTWYDDYYGNNLKYATITIGIPVDQFERALQRFRDLSIRVLDENATGEDVTDQYVDLQSQLQNLEATQARIQEFLKDAKTVDEALKINQQLSDIEGQIEEIKGRMNYLTNRAAFSTITVNFEPELPILTPTPTRTITPTLTPWPTSTPVPWKPGETFASAQRTVTTAYRGIFDFLIWLVVVILPILLPFALIGWILWMIFGRKSKKQEKSEKPEGEPKP